MTASEILGRAAAIAGYHAKKSEVHGMAQRGGSVESHLRFGREVFSTLIPKGRADFLVSFHKGEHARMKPFLKEGGADLIESLERAVQVLPDGRYLNTYLTGVLSKHLPIKEEHWLAALARVIKPQHLAANREVFLKARSE